MRTGVIVDVPEELAELLDCDPVDPKPATRRRASKATEKSDDD